MNNSDNVSRRTFNKTITTAIAGTVFLNSPLSLISQPLLRADLTIQNVIDIILKTIPGVPFEKTVDTIKAGSGEYQVKGIVTTMFATLEVIQKTIELGANFIIAHEPTFYNHWDETDWLKNSSTYQFKQELLDKHKITIWRFHDYWHTHRPDGILTGVLKTLEWEKYSSKEKANLLTIPTLTFGEIVSHAKKKFDINFVRVIGTSDERCRKIIILPGAPGGKRQIEALMEYKPDLLICGELSEWETAEYVRDSRLRGEQLSLIVLSHAVSEEAGMKWLVEWLQPKVSGIKVTHIPSGNPFSVM